MYSDALCHLSPEAFDYACRYAAKNLKAFPKPSELQEMARLYRAPSAYQSLPQPEGDFRLPPGYAKARKEIAHRVLSGQDNRETSKQIAALIDDFPAMASSLTAEANDWWHHVGHWPKEACSKAGGCPQRHLCTGASA